MLRHRRISAFVAATALAVPLAACGEDDVKDQIDQSRKDVRQTAKDLERKIDKGLSDKELREAARDVERKLDTGSADAKREARRLQRKIEGELKQHD